jgi:hypothetical protein
VRTLKRPIGGIDNGDRDTSVHHDGYVVHQRVMVMEMKCVS